MAGSITDWDSKTVIGSRAGGRGPSKATESQANAARRTGGVVETDRKLGVGNKSAAVDPDHQKIAALDRSDDPTAPKTISKDVGKAMQAARKDLEMTQKDLATKANEKPTVISDYESGKAIPSPQVLSKLERILKVKLRGKDIGSPLQSPAEKKATTAAKK